ncbi:MAG: phosphate regulon sensor histidine kinase PhoR [Nitrosomonadales bacterium]|nr:MAG: phosphate regulon sensor histidine kinase PhoR [Nitrosomonadales bacterium]
MQNFWWRILWLAIPTALLCLILWPLAGGGAALAVFCLLALSYFGGHLYQLWQLGMWLKNPRAENIPTGFGVWEDIFAGLHQLVRRHASSETELSSALERFQHATAALPDGIVVLNATDQIEWCNTTAQHQFGLNLEHDIGQRIAYLVRQQEFLDYLQAHHYSEPLKMHSLRTPDTTLEIQLVPFGNNLKLLICRDVSQLEKLEIMRRDFIANVSHELRTPLTVVAGFLETLPEMEGAMPESTRRYFELMQEQTNRMRWLVEDLLTLSQLESSQNIPQEAEIDVPTLLQTVLAEAKSLSKGRHHISLEADQTLWLRGSQQELHSAFGNLVSNAIRYTPDGGDITLHWNKRDNEAVFSVQDTGIGIEPQHISRLTERFYRVDRSRSRETGGTGLGLAIVKHILTRHQSRLEIRSEAGKGSTFSAVFPAQRINLRQVEAAA